MTKTTEAKWRRVIAAQSRSGLTVREFASAEGISAGTIYWWRSRLRRDGTKLVPVSVVERVRDFGADPASGSLELEVDGVTLRVPAGFDGAELGRLIRALRC